MIFHAFDGNFPSKISADHKLYLSLFLRQIKNSFCLSLLREQQLKLDPGTPVPAGVWTFYVVKHLC
jgi:hypothetical protein